MELTKFFIKIGFSFKIKNLNRREKGSCIRIIRRRKTLKAIWRLSEKRWRSFVSLRIRKKEKWRKRKKRERRKTKISFRRKGKQGKRRKVIVRTNWKGKEGKIRKRNKRNKTWTQRSKFKRW